MAHGKPVRASYCHGSREAACLKVHKDTAASNLSAHTRLFGLTYLEMREKVKSTLTSQRHVYTQRNKDLLRTGKEKNAMQGGRE